MSCASSDLTVSFPLYFMAGGFRTLPFTSSIRSWTRRPYSCTKRSRSKPADLTCIYTCTGAHTCTMEKPEDNVIHSPKTAIFREKRAALGGIWKLDIDFCVLDICFCQHVSYHNAMYYIPWTMTLLEFQSYRHASQWLVIFVFTIQDWPWSLQN